MPVRRRPIPDRQTWLEWRMANLNASEIGAAAGCDPYRTPLSLYSEKVGLIQPVETPLMRRGRWMEGASLLALRELYPSWRIEKCGVYLDDPELRLGATPDVIAESPDEPGLVNVQLKCVGKPTFEREWPDEEVPFRYALQTLAEGMLLGAARSVLAVLVLDTYTAELVLRPVPRQPKHEDFIRALAWQFWENIRNGVRPAADYQRDRETIAAMYPNGEPEPVLDLSGDNRLAELLPERADLVATRKTAGERIDTIDTEIKDKLQAHERATLPGWRIVWKNQIRSYKAVEAHTTTNRAFRVFKDDVRGQAP